MTANPKRRRFKGTVSDVVIQECETKLGVIKYAVGVLTPINPDFKGEKVSILTLDDQGIELLRRSKEGEKIYGVGYSQDFPDEGGFFLKGTFAVLEKVSLRPIIPYIDPNNLRATNFSQVGEDLVELLSEKEEIGRINDTISDLLVVASRMEKLDEVPSELKTLEVLKREVSTGQTIYHDIAESGQFGGFDRSLLTPKMLSIKNKNGDAPIHLIAKNQRLMYFLKEVITEELLDLEDKRGNTAVHLAAGTVSLEYLPVEFLTDRRMLKENKDGVSPMLIATDGRAILSVPDEVMRSRLILGENEDGVAPIDLVSTYNLKQVVRSFPEKTLRDYIEREDGGKTEMGRYGLRVIEDRKVEALKKEKLKVNDLLEQGKYEAAVELINSGGEINQRNLWGHTPLRTALQKGNLAVARLLVTKGAKLNVRDCEGYTIVQAMIKKGYVEAVKFLLQKGADLSLDRKGRNRGTQSTQSILRSASPEIQKIVNHHYFAASLKKNTSDLELGA